MTNIEEPLVLGVFNEIDIKIETDIENDIKPVLSNLEETLRLIKSETDFEDSVVEHELTNKVVSGQNSLTEFITHLEEKPFLVEPELNIKREEEDPTRCGSYPICGSEQNSEETSQYLKVNIKVDDDRDIFKCFSCDFKSMYKSSLIRHTTHLHSLQKFRCPHCDIQFKNKYYLKTHIKKHCVDNPVKFKCSLCDYETFHKNCLSAHAKQHLDTSHMFKCPHCDYRNREKRHLKTHIKKHLHNPEMAKCPHCDFKTLYEKNLKTHIKLHLHNPEMFKCSYCDFQSLYKNSVTVHTKTHLQGSQKFKCPYCDLQTLYKNNLKSHVEKLHSNAEMFKCPDCDYQTVYKRQLKYHDERHRKSEMKKCPYCEYQTLNRERFKLHVETVH